MYKAGRRDFQLKKQKTNGLTIKTCQLIENGHVTPHPPPTTQTYLFQAVLKYR